MAFTSRSERLGLKAPKSETPASLGPGTYVGPTQYSTGRVSYVPFSSSSPRKLAPRPNYTPGPGAYDSSKPHSRPAARSTFASKSHRFDFKTSEVPGPGAYVGNEPWVAQASPRRQRAKSESKSIQWNQRRKPPSIPAAAQSYGYVETDTGDLRLNPAPTTGHSGVGSDSAGPGAYNVPTQRRRAAQGPAWSKSTSRRLPLSGSSSSPGPGQYTETKLPPRYGIRPSANFASSSRRLGPSGASDDPGPGSYETGRNNLIKPSNGVGVGSFGSTAPRNPSFVKRSIAPGPGTYTSTPHMSDGDRAKLTGRVVPFSSLSQRFAEARATDTPGPGFYSAPSLSDRMSHRIVGHGAAFGTNVSRFSHNKGKSNETPGPGSYHRPRRRSRRRAKSSSMFKSSTERFTQRGVTEAPAPGAYNLKQEWIKTSKSKGPGFASRIPRFSMKRSDSVPGPGAYAGRAEQSELPQKHGYGSVFQSKSKRFNYKKPADNPPPSLSHGTLIKRSYNITVGNSGRV